MKTYLKPLTIALAALCLGFRADDTPLEKLLKQVAKLTATYPQEKVHLHIDKPYYVVGEEIWMKAYVVTAEKNEPSDLSKVLYVELIDQKDEVRKRAKLEIINGIAHGNLSLLDSLYLGNYRIRAFTNYMRNFGNEYFFQKDIAIGNVAEKKESVKKKPIKEDFEIQFFPEGGNMLNGTRNRIGVKAVTSNGLGLNLSGYIINRNKDKVAVFNTEHVGMGAFVISPQKGEKYTAIVTMPNGLEKSFKFPAAIESGFSIAVNKAGEQMTVRVLATPDQVGLKNMFIIAQVNGMVCASFLIPSIQQSNIATIPLKNLPTGIVHFTLFNANGIALSQRLAFMNHKDDLKLQILQKNPAKTVSKTILNLNVSDVMGNPVDGNFSVSITDTAQVDINEDDEMSILSNLLLSSDLKGHIEKPNYYFHHLNDDKERHLDYLLLTQGWSRFVWQDVVNEKEKVLNYRIEKSIEVGGNVTNEFSKPKGNVIVSLFSADKGHILKLDTITDQKGNFIFDRLAFADSTNLMLMAKTVKDSKAIKLNLNDKVTVEPYHFIGSTVNLDPYLAHTKKMFEELNRFNMLDKGIMLKEVVISKQRELKPLLNVPNSANAAAVVDYLITRKMLEKEFHILNTFNKVPGVYVKFNKIYRLRGQRSFNRPNGPMLLIIDGIRIDQDDMPDLLTSLYPGDVEGIEVITSDYNLVALGPGAMAGVIYITTKLGNPSASAATNTGRIKNAGFTTQKEFYMPNYDVPTKNKPMLDLRSTIYWNPNVNTDQNGNADISLFNASSPGKYRVVIEGMDVFGNLGRKVYFYEVK